MQIDIGKKARSALKSYFAPNAIPTADQFGQLIDSGLNQRDDGLVKVAGQPLAIEAVGDAGDMKRAVDFYLSFADDKPAWSIALQPRTMLALPGTGRLGWSVLNGAGFAQLTIDAATGNVGVGGVINPADSLHASTRVRAGTAAIGPWPANEAGGFSFFGDMVLDQTQGGNYALLQSHNVMDMGATFLNSPKRIVVRLHNSADKLLIQDSGIDVQAPLRVNATLTPSAGNTEANGILFPPDPGGGGGDRGWIRYYSRGGESMTLEIGTSNDGDDHIALMPSGNVGIGTNTPAARLDVIGQTRTSSNWIAPTTDLTTALLVQPTGYLNLVKFGSSGDYQILHKQQGQWKKPTLGYHCQNNHAIGFYTTGWTPMLECDGATGNVWIRGQLTQNSSAAHKRDVRPLPDADAAAILAGLQPVTYRWKDRGDALQLGFIAEDCPAAVTTAERDAIFGFHITAALTGVVRDQVRTIADLTRRLAALEAGA